MVAHSRQRAVLDSDTLSIILGLLGTRGGVTTDFNKAIVECKTKLAEEEGKAGPMSIAVKAIDSMGAVYTSRRTFKRVPDLNQLEDMVEGRDAEEEPETKALWSENGHTRYVLKLGGTVLEQGNAQQELRRRMDGGARSVVLDLEFTAQRTMTMRVVIHVVDNKRQMVYRSQNKYPRVPGLVELEEQLEKETWFGEEFQRNYVMKLNGTVLRNDNAHEELRRYHETQCSDNGDSVCKLIVEPVEPRGQQPDGVPPLAMNGQHEAKDGAAANPKVDMTMKATTIQASSVRA